MADFHTSISSTALDFDNIKASLIAHFQNQTEFADYDFETSALTTIMDILSYNTHYNGLIANFGLNEAFLNTAQLRPSVLAHAQNLGYNVKSRTSSVGYITMDILGVTVSDRASTITLPIGTKFTGSVNGTSYVFETRSTVIGTDDGGGNYSFLTSDDSTTIPIYQGTQKTKTFYAGAAADENLYVIPDVNLDTSTITVNVYDDRNSTNYNTYTNLSTAVTLTSESKHYILRESPNGYFELSFGDGVLTGSSPSAGNKIVVNYLNTVGDAANGVKLFGHSGSVTIGSSAYTITSATVTNSAGGSDKESIRSIRKNAPAVFASQNRLVTAEDYRAIILNKYSASLDDVVAWGGEDHVPKTYGKVFVSLKFPTGSSDVTKALVKQNITTNITDPLSVMSIDTEFIDPEEIYLALTTTYNFNPNRSGLSAAATKTLVKNSIDTYVDTELSFFSSVFRRSILLAEIDNLDEGILNSKMDTKIVKRLEPVLNTSATYTIDFPVTLAAIDDENYIITSTTFTLGGDATCYFRNKLNSDIIEVVNGVGTIIKTNIGYYGPSDGNVVLTGFAPEALYLSRDYIKVIAVPANQSTVRPLRNYVLDYDAELSAASVVTDYEEIAVTL